MAEAYKNYLVNEETENGTNDWTVATFHTFKEAVDFAKSYNPRPEVDNISVYATDEDPDTYINYDRVYSINPHETPEEKKLRELANRILNIADPWEAKDETDIKSTIKAIKEDPQKVIEYLLNMIEEPFKD